MASTTLENMWKILMENNIQTPCNISSDLICRFCNKIMIKPCNVPCGCRYCFTCLEKYLDGKDKFCLGESDYCRDEMISLYRNVLNDPPINVRISKLVVQCPMCQFQTELSKMSDHISMCDKKPLSCPYFSIGCLQDKICIDEIKDHFAKEDYSHSKLLMEFVDNSRNEIKLLKMDFMRLEHENTFFKDELLNCQSNINSKQEIILSLQEVEKKNSVEMEVLKEEITALKNENKEMNEKLTIVINMEMMRQKSPEELTPLGVGDKSLPKELCNSKWGDTRSEVKNFFDLTILASNLQTKNEDDWLVPIGEERKSQHLEKHCKEDGVPMIPQISTCSNERPFLWCIDNWNDIFRQAKSGFCKQICSDPFYRNGYKMLLRVYPIGCGNGEGVSMFLSICIVKGEFDDNLKWPFRHGLQVDLTNKESSLCYVTKTRKYSDSPRSEAWKKPSEKNIGIGFDNFINLAKLSEIVHNHLDNKLWLRITLQSMAP